jgi:5-methylcytosine-specific restriction protein A
MKVVRRQRWKEAGRFEAAGVCRWCGRQVPRPRRFCDDPQCKVEVRIRAEPRFARSRVGRRDRGVCAICGCDTLKLFRIFRHAQRDSGSAGLVPLWRELGFHGHWGQCGDRWQCDHIVPVVEGGGGCGLDNLRTLCSPCHKAATAALARRRAEQRALEGVSACCP